MATKFKLNPEPTFKAKVGIPVPGSAPVDVQFTFKHRTRDEIKAMPEQLDDMEEVVAFREIVVGWDLDDEFNDDNIRRLLNNYNGASQAISNTYFAEILGARRGN